MHTHAHTRAHTRIPLVTTTIVSLPSSSLRPPHNNVEVPRNSGGWSVRHGLQITQVVTQVHFLKRLAKCALCALYILQEDLVHAQ